MILIFNISKDSIQRVIIETLIFNISFSTNRATTRHRRIEILEQLTTVRRPLGSVECTDCRGYDPAPPEPATSCTAAQATGSPGTGRDGRAAAHFRPVTAVHFHLPSCGEPATYPLQVFYRHKYLVGHPRPRRHRSQQCLLPSPVSARHNSSTGALGISSPVKRDDVWLARQVDSRTEA
jgi:hypothetical protein